MDYFVSADGQCRLGRLVRIALFFDLVWKLCLHLKTTPWSKLECRVEISSSDCLHEEITAFGNPDSNFKVYSCSAATSRPHPYLRTSI